MIIQDYALWSLSKEMTILLPWWTDNTNLTAAFIPHAGAPTCITARRHPFSCKYLPLSFHCWLAFWLLFLFVCTFILYSKPELEAVGGASASYTCPNAPQKSVLKKKTNSKKKTWDKNSSLSTWPPAPSSSPPWPWSPPGSWQRTPSKASAPRSSRSTRPRTLL